MHLVLHVLLVFTFIVSRGRTGRPSLYPSWHQSFHPWHLYAASVHLNQSVPNSLRESHPVCVVGAGISGLNLGILLKAKGYNVEIFEEKDRVGGKAETYREGNSTVQIDTGPLLFTNGGRALLSYVKKYQLTTLLFNYRENRSFDAESGSIQAIPGPTGDEAVQFETALDRYIQYHAEYRNDLDYGYLNTSPDLFLPFSTWLTARNLSILKPFFNFPVTIEGYGHLDDIPALYVLKFVGPNDIYPVLSTLNESFYVLKEGVSTLVEKMAEGLHVNLNHKVNSIVRYHDFQEIQFEGNQPKRKCQRVILAFPPLLRKLEKVVRDLSPAEKDVLKHVKIHKYVSAGHHLPPLDQMFYYEGITHPNPRQVPIVLPSPEGRSEVIAMLKQSIGTLQNTYSSYTWIRGDFDSGATEAELDQIRNQLEQFQRKISPKPELLFVRSTDYFPHVTTDSLQNGFYYQFNMLQGMKGLYYATTLLTFETLNAALLMTENFVDKYF